MCITSKRKKRAPIGLVQDTIDLTKSEEYHVDREHFYDGKRIIELPDANRYSLEQRVDDGKN